MRKSVGGSTQNNSFDLETNAGTVAALTGHGSSATSTVTTPGDDWHAKLYAKPGLALEAGKNYQISMNVKSIIPAPFEVCFNNGDEEKGLGAIFGLISTPSGQYVEYATYPKQDTQLVIQLSLGNCSAPNSIVLGSLKVERAGTIHLISDTIYTF